MENRVDNRLVEIFGMETIDLMTGHSCLSKLKRSLKYIYETSDTLITFIHEQEVQNTLYILFGKKQTRKLFNTSEYSMFKTLLESCSNESYIPDICSNFIKNIVQTRGTITTKIRFRMLKRRETLQNVVQDNMGIEEDTEEHHFHSRMFHILGSMIDNTAEFQRQNKQVYREYERLLLRIQRFDKDVREIRIQIIEQWSEKLVNYFSLHVDKNMVVFNGFTDRDRPVIRSLIDETKAKVKLFAFKRCDIVKALNKELESLKNSIIYNQTL